MVVHLTASTLVDTWNKEDKELLCKVINKKIENDNVIDANIIRARFRQWSANSKHSVKERSEGDEISRIIDILSTSTREHRYFLYFIFYILFCICKLLFD